MCFNWCRGRLISQMYVQSRPARLTIHHGPRWGGWRCRRGHGISIFMHERSPLAAAGSSCVILGSSQVQKIWGVPHSTRETWSNAPKPSICVNIILKWCRFFYIHYSRNIFYPFQGRKNWICLKQSWRARMWIFCDPCLSADGTPKSNLFATPTEFSFSSVSLRGAESWITGTGYSWCFVKLLFTLSSTTLGILWESHRPDWPPPSPVPPPLLSNLTCRTAC